MPESKVAQSGGARVGAGRKTKHADGSVQINARISRIAINRLDAVRRAKESRADVLERLIETEYRRVFGPAPQYERGEMGLILPSGG
jgi:hypothetical protein